MKKNLFIAGALFACALSLTLLVGCKKKEASSYTVSFNTFGGSTIPSQSVEANGKATAPDVASVTKTNYTFISNWYTGTLANIANPVAFDFATPITADITLYAGMLLTTISVDIDNNTGGASAPTLPVFTKENVILIKDPTTSSYIYDIFNVGGGDQTNSFYTRMSDHIIKNLKGQGVKNAAGKDFKGLSFKKDATTEADLIVGLNADNTINVKPSITVAVPPNDLEKTKYAVAIAEFTARGNVSLINSVTGADPSITLYAAYY